MTEPPAETDRGFVGSARLSYSNAQPEAGAIFYSEYELPINSAELINRLVAEKSVLITTAEHFGLEKGIRIGFGYDVEKLLKGLARAEALIHAMR